MVKNGQKRSTTVIGRKKNFETVVFSASTVQCPEQCPVQCTVHYTVQCTVQSTIQCTVHEIFTTIAFHSLQ